MRCEPGWQGDVHMHPFWEILLVCAGSGAWRHGKRTAPLSEGDLILIGPEQRHAFAASPTSTLTLFYAGFAFTPDRAVTVDVPGPLSGVAGLSAIRDEVRLIAEVLTARGDGLAYATRRRLFHALTRLVDTVAAPDNNADALTREQALVEKAKRFMEEHLRRPLTVRDVARVFYLSPHYFADLFRQSAGMTVKQYHETVRLREAALLLRDRTRSITEISHALGYSSVHYFSRRFKRYYKVSPSAFRE